MCEQKIFLPTAYSALSCEKNHRHQWLINVFVCVPYCHAVAKAKLIELDAISGLVTIIGNPRSHNTYIRTHSHIKHIIYTHFGHELKTFSLLRPTLASPPVIVYMEYIPLPAHYTLHPTYISATTASNDDNNIIITVYLYIFEVAVQRRRATFLALLAPRIINILL